MEWGYGHSLLAWVRVPTLSSTADTIIYMCYGDFGVTTSQEHKTGVWDSNYKGVWHLPDPTTLSLNDSTSNINNGTNHGASAIAGKIGGAINCNGTNQYVTLNNNSSLNFDSGNFTLSVWVKNTGSTSGGQVTKGLLPSSYTFSMNYAYRRQEKAQNVSSDPTVVFQRGRVHPESGACTQYYVGGWRSFTQDFELLPLTYTFRFNDGTPDSPISITMGIVNHIH